MGEVLAIAIIGLFSGLVLVNDVRIGSRIKFVFGIDPLRMIKPFDCVPCMTFWYTAALSPFISHDLLTCAAGTCLAYIVAIKYQ